MFIVNGWSKIAEIDSYNEGCTGEVSLAGGHDTFTSDDINELLEELKSFTGHDSIDIDGSAGEVSILGLENTEGYQATKHEIEDWKENKITLWSVCYTFSVYEASLYQFGE